MTAPRERHVDWDIVPFERVGPIRFGMSPAAVAEVLGAPYSARTQKQRSREFRELDEPVVTYVNGEASEIESFYDVANLRLGEINLFRDPGKRVMRSLERMNGGAGIHVGIVLFANLGLTCGRLDGKGREDRSVTAFARGLWDDSLGNFEPIGFG